ncbi:adenylate/guanylate cyclase domain-containing protein [Algiphilus sp. NNCM1]|uniref:adenylate/guanylate cyclase domain-containing protein n=1 Tax=Algiphilus sp. TaxID=1872431 RepID=UPI001CA79FEA|nr:adenylate/guanylate cyclase domain-containing protein [Algiphilus sp.]MBY8965531.1 adenylate/guanylate cyclase domain-containing protein [Algiphilus acroporae]MCI5063480.1 adenylate/guanylate cyclase domain-containing protein [Algiphilus sp.]MCI5102986.1 adenylate/guanylate cyclase domain-containing protein [Algiphilus sp.]
MVEGSLQLYFQAYLLVALVCAGMGVAFFVADRRTPSSRALALAFAAIGLSLWLHMVLPQWFDVPLWLWRSFVAVDGIAMVALLQWIYYVRATLPSAALRTRTGDTLVRLGQGSAAVYVLLGVVAPAARDAHFLNALALDGSPHHLWFWAFASPVLVSSVSGTLSLLLLLNRRPDALEQLRVFAMLLAIPLLGASFALPPQWAPISLLLGALVFLIGAMRYHVEQGRRGEFMAQFLSPQVADLVRRHGLEGATAAAKMEISAVCIDLRGFTGVTAETDSEAVLSVLREYYAAVGQVAARFGGTIKDQAGDGVLILVGAPVADPEHRRHAIDMACALKSLGDALSAKWRASGLDLGVGVGAASGTVAVGVIGEGGRREYTAVGNAVNLAARLCAQAADGDVLLAPDMVEAVERSGDACFEAVATPMQLKGLPEPIQPLRLC